MCASRHAVASSASQVTPPSAVVIGGVLLLTTGAPEGERAEQMGKDTVKKQAEAHVPEPSKALVPRTARKRRNLVHGKTEDGCSAEPEAGTIR